MEKKRHQRNSANDDEIRLGFLLFFVFRENQVTEIGVYLKKKKKNMA